MDRLPCPLPEVEQALAPYIKTRQEALRIRQHLTSHLASQIRVVDNDSAETTHLTLTCPPENVRVNRIPPEMTGLRRRYLEALQANIAAREQCAALKEELGELRRAHLERTYATPSDSDPDSAPAKREEASRTYVALLRQRKKLQKLRTIHAALERIVNVQPNLAETDVQELLRRTLGDAPAPPTVVTLGNGAPGSGEEETEELLFRLKKEVLEARQGMLEMKASAGKWEAQGEKGDLEAQVYALRCARDRLVEWVEGQLARITEGESEIAGEEQGADEENEPEDQESPQMYERKIKDLYEEYAASRQAFMVAIKQVTAPPKEPETSPTSPKKSEPSRRTESSSKALKAADLIPFAPTLLLVASEEKALLQQTTFLRQQMAQASEETQKTISRLAHESPLVPPGATSAMDWVHAAEEAAEETKQFLEEQLREGEAHLTETQKILEELQARKDLLQQLDGTL